MWLILLGQIKKNMCVSGYGKCPKISNTLKFWTPIIFAQNNFWKCPKISNSSSFAKRGFLKFRTQLASNNVLPAHSNFGNFFFFFSVTEPETKVAVLKATAKRICTQQCHNEFYVHKWHGNRILIYTNPGDTDWKSTRKKKKTSITMLAISTWQSHPRDKG